MAKEQFGTEDYFPIAIGGGMYTSELPSNIPEGFSPVCYNAVASGDSIENRIGIRRSSLDWKVGEYAPVASSGISAMDFMYKFWPLFPWSGDSTKPAFAWSSSGVTIPGGAAAGTLLNFVRASGTVDANDGFLSTVLPASVYGVCQYQDNIYFALSGQGIQKITAINWALDTITYTHVVSSGTMTLRDLFTFKDRLWAYATNANSHRLYYTTVPTVGGLPETWASGSQFIQFVSPGGRGEIKKIVPVGNRLLVFTSNGLFSLLVEGEPASWILRIIDSKSVSTSSQCAFESKGIVYYVNTQGVWATNGQSAAKYSGTIEDQWFLAKGARAHSIVSYEDGMIVSVAKLNTDTRYFDKDNCRVFYSKLDPVAWTEWNFNRNGLGTLPEHIAMIWSATDKIPTYLNTEPTVYVMAAITDSTPAAQQRATIQVLVMDGGEDQYVDRANVVQTQPVGMYFKTKSFDGGNQYRYKLLKKGLLEVFTSDAEHKFTTSWDNDFTTSEASEIEERTLQDFTVGNGSNLVTVKAGFQYRRAALNFKTTLQSSTSQVKVKDITAVQERSRDTFEQVS